MRPPLYDHQNEALHFLKDRERGALLMEMGTGKTRIVLERIASGEIPTPALVVIPNSLFYSWGKELSQFPELSSVALTGTREQRLAKLHGPESIFLLNYDYLSPLRAALLRKRFKSLVFDESTMVKNPGAKRTRAAIKLADCAEHVYILTGTCMANAPLDVFCQFRLLGEDVLGDSFYNFRNAFAIINHYKGFPEIVGYRDLDVIQNRLSEFSFVKLKRECLDLPPKTFEERRVELLPEQRKLYDQVKDEILMEFEESPFSTPLAITKMLRLSQIIGGHLTTDDGKMKTFPSVKERELVRIVRQAQPQKVVVWCRFRYEIERVTKLLKSFHPVVLHGDVSVTDRGKRIESFQENDKTRVLISQIQVGKFGLTLTAGTVAVYYSKTYSLEDYLQSQDRIHRIGQVHPVTIINLNATGTLDVSLQNALQKKREFAALITPQSIESVISGSLT
jgi:SNF2 family DNA or RNA helicase